MPGQPIRFIPLFMERVWGGRRLQELYGKELPPGPPIGESWEVVDRPEAQSVVTGGRFDGLTLHALWSDRREELFGVRATVLGERFPIIVKLLDACQTLSVQVHPPADVAGALGGEPKNELWYMAAATPDAHLYVGLRAGVTRGAFSAALEAGHDVSGMLHRLPVNAGDAILIPSGRVHTIGAGCLIMEIQQNSDTTYRVFDFNRPGLDGHRRQLHVAQSMASIDWDDVQPSLQRGGDRNGREDGDGDGDGPIVADGCFVVTRYALTGSSVVSAPGECAIVAVVDGTITCGGHRFRPGTFFLIPAVDGAALPVAPTDDCGATVLVTELPG